MIQKTDAQGQYLIKWWEECWLHPYLDADKLWTIGWGRQIPPALALQYKDGITQAQADAWFLADIASAEAAVATLHLTSQDVFNAFCCFAYNVGVTAFKTSTLYRCLQRGDVMSAARLLLAWDHGDGGVELLGLFRRRLCEGNVALNGIYPTGPLKIVA